MPGPSDDTRDTSRSRPGSPSEISEGNSFGHGRAIELIPDTDPIHWTIGGCAADPEPSIVDSSGLPEAFSEVTSSGENGSNTCNAPDTLVLPDLGMGPEVSYGQSDSVWSIGNEESESSFGFDLRIELREAFVRSVEPASSEFLPLDKLEQILSYAKVLQELESSFPGASTYVLQQTAGSICNAKGHSSRRIFAVLLLVERTDKIIDFVNEGVYDSDLPLLLRRTEIKPFRLSIFTLANSTKPLNCLKGCSPFILESFERYQWYLLAPFFSGGRNSDEKVLFYSLQDKTILPFVDDGTSSSYDGGYSQVSRVKIHPAHHDFAEPQTGPPEHFALKKLTSRHRDDFEQEVETLKRFSRRGYTHLIRLLATFHYRGGYYLLFPWADGNLHDFWQREHPTDDHTLYIWMAEQCYGIARGLSFIHNYQPSWDKFKLPRQEREMMFGRHGDLKPQNILYFRRSGALNDMGTLKIADFGLSRFHSHHTGTRSKNRGLAVSPTYRPPECDAVAVRSISRSFDIWTLGCIYLEFVVWLLYGAEGLRAFSEDRLDEDKLAHGSEGHPFFEDTFFSVIRSEGDQVLRLKHSVLQWIDKMHAHPKCTPFAHDILTITLDKLLVPDSMGRAPILHLAGCLNMIRCKCLEQPAYLTPAPWLQHKSSSSAEWRPAAVRYGI
ncbi:kinase-like domain-containing protein [Xylariaceae sp. AK1471]|nr:kinase-like domain-containing protein [Xylariaceae sp. AK1471]